MALRKKKSSRKACRWYGGSTAEGYEAKKLCYRPTSRRHPRGWRYANGPWKTKKNALRSFVSPIAIRE